jgi:hypothetical protein
MDKPECFCGWEIKETRMKNSFIRMTAVAALAILALTGCGKKAENAPAAGGRL